MSTRTTVGPTMKAARVHGWGETPVVDEVPVPRPAPEESLIKVEAAAVAHLDLTVAGGRFGIKPELPYIGGVEGCGVVTESDVLEVGTRVVIRGAGVGLVRAGTWAEYVTVRSSALTPVFDGLGPALGATFWVPTTTAHTALHAVGRLGKWISGPEHVLVAGAAGAVGSMVVQLALREGATVTALVLDDAQAGALPQGVEALMTSDEAAMEEFTKERPGSLLVDMVGGPGLAQRLKMVRAGGRAALVGYAGGTDVALELSNWLLDDVAMLPVNMIRREKHGRALAPELASLLATGDLTLNLEQFPLEDVGLAIERLRTGRLQGRGVLVPSG